ncbi:MAG: hypothetical protein WC648_03915 [Candidatus Paceibacterota bacterium]|jgi:hypothetical protein
MPKLFTHFKKTFIGLGIFAIIFTSLAIAPSKAEAQAGTVPIGTHLDFNSIMDHLKEFVLDKAAVAIANQVLQRMTASVVGWINSGFEGSPAFLQNPEGFFLDVADQVTGEFLLGSPLSALCSPISIDIRLSLALSQTEMLQNRYTCTLNKIIQAQKNGPDITINGEVVNSSGATDDFTNGNFYAGGWDAFMALTTEPQNNPSGAFLMAESDLNVAISEKKIAIKADLQMGNGFMSWEKCKDVTAQANAGAYDKEDQLFKSGNQTVNTGKTDLNKNTSLKSKVDKNGNVTYQDCQVQTPGSVIGGTLQRQLNVPADKLVLVKTISDSIDAIMGALVNQMLTQGLASLSKGGSSVSGDGRAYLTELQDEANRKDNTTTQSQIADALTVQNSNLENYKSIYDEAVALITSVQTALNSARACFDTKSKNLSLGQDKEMNYAQNKIAGIDTIIANRIYPILLSALTKQKEATDMLAEQEQQTNDAASGIAGDFVLDSSNDPTVNPFDDFQDSVADSEVALKDNLQASTIATTDITKARKELEAIRKETDSLMKQSQEFQASCTAFPNNMD